MDDEKESMLVTPYEDLDAVDDNDRYLREKKALSPILESDEGSTGAVTVHFEKEKEQHYESYIVNDSNQDIPIDEGIELDEVQLHQADELVHDHYTSNPRNPIRRSIQYLKNQPSSFWKCIHLSWAFFFVFLGYNPTQNIITNIHPNDGAIGLGVLYGCFAFGALVAPILLEKMGLVLSLTFSAFTYALFVYSAMDIFKVLFIPACALIGFGAGLLWSSQPVYLNRISPSESVLGFYSGLFQAIYTCSGIIGNTITGSLTTSGAVSIDVILLILGSSCILGTIMLALLRKASPKQADKPTQSLKEILLGIKGIFTDKRFIYIIPICIVQGQSQAYFYDTLPTMIGLKRIGYIMVVFALVAVIASYIWGRLIDIKPKAFLVKALTILWALSIGVSFIVYFVDNLVVYYVLIVINGSFDCLQTLYIFALIATIFKDNIFGFGAGRVIQSIFTCIGFFVFQYLPFMAIIAWLGILVAVMFFTTLSLLKGLENGRFGDLEKESFQKLNEEEEKTQLK